MTSLFTIIKGGSLRSPPAPAAGARFARVLAAANDTDARRPQAASASMPTVHDAERQQRSREFGVKLAKALQQRAVKARREHDPDPRYVMLGAGDYLRDAADFQLDPPLDDTHIDPGERSN